MELSQILIALLVIGYVLLYLRGKFYYREVYTDGPSVNVIGTSGWGLMRKQ